MGMSIILKPEKGGRLRRDRTTLFGDHVLGMVFSPVADKEKRPVVGLVLKSGTPPEKIESAREELRKVAKGPFQGWINENGAIALGATSHRVNQSSVASLLVGLQQQKVMNPWECQKAADRFGIKWDLETAPDRQAPS